MSKLDATIIYMSKLAREINQGWIPIDKWGPVCAGCGAPEYRFDGYCHECGQIGCKGTSL